MRFNIHFLATITPAIAFQLPLEHVPNCMTTTAAKTGYNGPGYYKVLSLQSPDKVAVNLSTPVINSPVVAS